MQILSTMLTELSTLTKDEHAKRIQIIMLVAFLRIGPQIRTFSMYGFFTHMNKSSKKNRAQGIKALRKVGPTLTMRKGVRNLSKADKE